MPSETYIRAAVARGALMQLVRPVRDSVCLDEGFCARLGVGPGYIVTLGDRGPTLSLEVVAAAVGAVLEGAREKRPRDTDGRQWTLRASSGGDGEPALTMMGRGLRFSLGMEFLALAPNLSVRLKLARGVRDAARWAALTGRDWLAILKDRPLALEELVAITEDLEDTPSSRGAVLRRGVERGQLALAMLVPNARRHFERLVGVWEGSATLAEYSAKEGLRHLTALAGWPRGEGLLASLYLGADVRLTDRMDVGAIAMADLTEILGGIRERGDILARVSAAEIGLRALQWYPDVAIPLTRLVECIRDDDAERVDSSIGSFACLFHLVECELSRRHVFRREPAYYRRLASVAHAAFVQREVGGWLSSREFREWAWSNSALRCRMQSYVDRRTLPRWDWRFGAPSHFRGCFVRRIVYSGQRMVATLRRHEVLYDVVQRLPGCLHKEAAVQEFRMSLPTPVEGPECRLAAMPEETSRALESKFDAEGSQGKIILELGVSAQIWELGPSTVAAAVRALRGSEWRLTGVRSGDELAAAIRAAAEVAAICRDDDLAQAVRNLVRRYRLSTDVRLSMGDALECIAIAAASQAKLVEWARAMGEGFVEMAFAELTQEEGRVLHACIRSLAEIAPELWVYCGRAEAAIVSYTCGIGGSGAMNGDPVAT